MKKRIYRIAEKYGYVITYYYSYRKGEEHRYDLTVNKAMVATWNISMAHLRGDTEDQQKALEQFKKALIE